jgi:hypothetical protein
MRNEPEALAYREAPDGPEATPPAPGPSGARRRRDRGEPRPGRGRFGLVVAIGLAWYLAVLGLLAVLNGRGGGEPSNAPRPAAAAPEGPGRAQ